MAIAGKFSTNACEALRRNGYLPEYGKTPQIWQKEFRPGHRPSLRGRTSPALKPWTENPELGSNFNLDSVFGRGTQVDFDCAQKSPRAILSLIVYEAR
jgi:hypothetical protein